MPQWHMEPSLRAVRPDPSSAAKPVISYHLNPLLPGQLRHASGSWPPVQHLAARWRAAKFRPPAVEKNAWRWQVTPRALRGRAVPGHAPPAPGLQPRRGRPLSARPSRHGGRAGRVVSRRHGSRGLQRTFPRLSFPADREAVTGAAAWEGRHRGPFATRGTGSIPPALRPASPPGAGSVMAVSCFVSRWSPPLPENFSCRRPLIPHLCHPARSQTAWPSGLSCCHMPDHPGR